MNKTRLEKIKLPTGRSGLGASAIGGLTYGLVIAIALGACSTEQRKSKPAAARSKKAVVTSSPAVDCHVRKCIALTFDDGPVPEDGRLLDILKENGARATFFVLGGQVATNVDMLRREANEGHEIGNHSFTHAKLAGAPLEKVEDEIIRTQDAIKQVTGKAPVVFRPTYGATDKQLDMIAVKENLAEILWSVDPLDWKDHDTNLVKKRVLDGAKPGFIILMHDTRPTTIAAVPDILKTLSQQGYAFVTVSELFRGVLTPGEKYPAFLGAPTTGPSPPGG
jgi:peptidoglycan/xylan/chitin deacetylase (PgdA/CDA1 family)